MGSKKLVLHVGCGAKTLKQMPIGFQNGLWEEIRFDIADSARPDIHGTMLDMSAVATGTFDALYTSHNIEHVETFEVPIVLGNFRRVLKANGFVIVTCPDIAAVAQKIVEQGVSEPLYRSNAGVIAPLDVLFGHGEAIQRGEKHMAHRTGFDIKRLVDCLKEAGFVKVAGLRDGNALALWAVGTCWSASSEELRDLAERYFGEHGKPPIQPVPVSRQSVPSSQS